jgi:hypothetical protein
MLGTGGHRPQAHDFRIVLLSPFQHNATSINRWTIEGKFSPFVFSLLIGTSTSSTAGLKEINSRPYPSLSFSTYFTLLKGKA